MADCSRRDRPATTARILVTFSVTRYGKSTAPFNASSDTRWGGTVGVGLEFGFAPNWSVGFEYDHLFMGSPNITFAPTNIAVGRADTIGEGVDIGTVRLDYHFGGGAPVIAKY
jgi:outer membrane immunogenic protein